MILLNGNNVKFTTFPNGELLIDDFINKLILKDKVNHILFKFQDNSDFLKLFFVKKHLDSQNILANLLISYMPYSRMDRSKNNSVFTLKYVADLINSLNFTKVFVIEAHSDVTHALIDRCIPVNATHRILRNAMDEIGFNEEVDYLFYPDQGAAKRYGDLQGNQLTGYKDRDWKTGKITKLDIVGDLPNHPFKAIIVDDMSSYGGTFIMSAEKLIEAGATEVYLVIAHAEETIFKGSLFGSGLIKKVFTTDSILNINDFRPENENYYAENDLIKVYTIQEVIR